MRSILPAHYWASAHSWVVCTIATFWRLKRQLGPLFNLSHITSIGCQFYVLGVEGSDQAISRSLGFNQALLYFKILPSLSISLVNRLRVICNKKSRNISFDSHSGEVISAFDLVSLSFLCSEAKYLKSLLTSVRVKNLQGAWCSCGRCCWWPCCSEW